SFIEQPIGLLERDEELVKPHLTWDQMSEIASTSAVEFGSHTHSHKSASAERNNFEADLKQSIELMEKELGERPIHLAYPYGQCNEVTHQIAMECGFETIVTMEDVPLMNGPVQGRLDIYQRNQTLPYFKLTLAGLLGPAMRQRMRKLLYRGRA
ncbi:MAG: polysaccharide deacetylase family protein, partial [Chloroflexota bacterium]